MSPISKKNLGYFFSFSISQPKSQFRDVDQSQRFLGAFVLKAGNQGPCGIQSGDDVNTGLDGSAADEEAVTALVTALGRGIDNKVDLMAQDKVDDRR